MRTSARLLISGGLSIAISALAAGLTAPASKAQQVKTIQLGEGQGKAYSFHGITNGRMRSFASDGEARGVVQSIMSAMGLPLRFEIRAAAVGNAAAILQPDGTRMIL